MWRKDDYQKDKWKKKKRKIKFKKTFPAERKENHSSSPTRTMCYDSDRVK